MLGQINSSMAMRLIDVIYNNGHALDTSDMLDKGTNPLDIYTLFTDEITLVVMPKKFTFPSVKMNNWTNDPDNHIAQYKQRMFTTAIAKDNHKANMCEGFGSSLTEWPFNGSQISQTVQ